MRWNCQALISNKEVLLLPKPAAKRGALIHSLSRRRCRLLNLNSDSNASAMFRITFPKPLAGWRRFHFFQKQRRKTDNALLRLTRNVETNTFDGEKLEVSDRNPTARRSSCREIHVRMNSHCAHALTLTRPDKPMTKSSRVAASQNLAWRPSRPPTPPRARRARLPCNRDSVSPGWCIMNGGGMNRRLWNSYWVCQRVCGALLSLRPDPILLETSVHLCSSSVLEGKTTEENRMLFWCMYIYIYINFNFSSLNWLFMLFVK